MPNLKDLKIRIESVKSTRKITKAMQMVAAAKLRKAQETAESSRRYSEKMSDVVSNLCASMKGNEVSSTLLRGTGKDQKHLYIVATAERGLCGGFNSSIVKMAKSTFQKLLKQNKDFKIVTVGKKGREQLEREYGNFFLKHFELIDAGKTTYEIASGISEYVINQYREEGFDTLTVYFNKFQSVISQVPTDKMLIPAMVNGGEDRENVTYEYEPEEDEILAELLPKAITTYIYTALLENAASEQGARMSAMDNATRNAGEMIDKLTIQFNRSRQAAITNELIEIISGAEAL